MIPTLLIVAALALVIADQWGDSLPDWLVDDVPNDD